MVAAYQGSLHNFVGTPSVGLDHQHLVVDNGFGLGMVGLAMLDDLHAVVVDAAVHWSAK